MPGLDLLIVEVSRSHTGTHIRYSPSERVISPWQRPTRTTHHIHKRRTSMLSAGFEPVIPATKRLQTYALDRTHTWIR